MFKEKYRVCCEQFLVGEIIFIVVLSQLFCKFEFDIVVVKEVGELVCGFILVDGSVFYYLQEFLVCIRVGFVENDFFYYVVVVLFYV